MTEPEKASVDVMREAGKLLDKVRDVLARRFPRCRDCADFNGTCPQSGLPCDLTKEFTSIKTLLAPPPQAAEASVGQKSELADLIKAAEENGDLNDFSPRQRRALAVAPPPPEIGEEEIAQIIKWASGEACFNGAGKVINPEVFTEGANRILALIKTKRGV